LRHKVKVIVVSGLLSVEILKPMNECPTVDRSAGPAELFDATRLPVVSMNQRSKSTGLILTVPRLILTVPPTFCNF